MRSQNAPASDLSGAPTAETGAEPKFRTEGTRAYYRLFCELREELGTTVLPRSALTPPRSKAFIQYLVIVQRLPGTGLIYRLVGTGVVNRLGVDLTNKPFLDGLSAETAEMYSQYFSALTDTPCAAVFSMSEACRDYVNQVEMLSFPMTNKDGEIDMIVSVSEAIERPSVPTGPFKNQFDEAARLQLIDLGFGVGGFRGLPGIAG